MILAIFVGGGIGAILRYLVSCPINKRFIPWGTFTVNITGAFLFGLITSIIKDEYVKFLLITGFCGGYTTFSTFAKEITFLNKKTTIIYCFLTIIMGFISILLGLNITNFFS